MSERNRNILATGLIILLAVTAFSSGYLTRHLGVVPSVLASEDDFAVYAEALDLVESNFLGDWPTEQELEYGAIRGALTLLNDPYTVFIEPVVRVQERESLQGTFGGVGAYLSRPEEGGVIYLEPIPGNPAAAAGILTQDILVAVDGVLVTPEMTVAEVVDMIKGEKGTAVILTVQHEGAAETTDIEIIRDDILIPSVTSRILAEDPTIGYIRLTRFSGESRNEMSEAITQLVDDGAEKLILDLRGNGGGLLNAAVDIADLFLSDGAVVYQQVKGENERVANATNITLVPDLPLMILVDNGTASASEILAGALQDRGRSLLIGNHKTYGKGSVQLVFDLSDGSSVHVTSARWLTPNRNQIDQQGLQPDVMVVVSQEAIDNGIDLVLNQAIEQLQSE